MLLHTVWSLAVNQHILSGHVRQDALLSLTFPKSILTSTSRTIEVSSLAARHSLQYSCGSGRTRFDRLLLIGTTAPLLAPEALRSAVIEAKQGRDVGRYEAALAAIREILPGDAYAIPDSLWIDRTNKQVKAETDRLNMELKGYKNNLIKESTRVQVPLPVRSPHC